MTFFFSILMKKVNYTFYDSLTAVWQRYALNVLKSLLIETYHFNRLKIIIITFYLELLLKILISWQAILFLNVSYFSFQRELYENIHLLFFDLFKSSLWVFIMWKQGHKDWKSPLSVILEYKTVFGKNNLVKFHLLTFLTSSLFTYSCIACLLLYFLMIFMHLMSTLCIFL